MNLSWIRTGSQLQYKEITGDRALKEAIHHCRARGAVTQTDHIQPPSQDERSQLHDLNETQGTFSVRRADFEEQRAGCGREIFGGIGYRGGQDEYHTKGPTSLSSSATSKLSRRGKELGSIKVSISEVNTSLAIIEKQLDDADYRVSSTESPLSSIKEAIANSIELACLHRLNKTSKLYRNNWLQSEDPLIR